MSWIYFPELGGVFHHRLTFWVGELPQSYQRGRMAKTKDGNLFQYTPMSMVHYQNRVRNAFSLAAREGGRYHEYPWDVGPVEASIICYFPLPKSGKVSERSRCKARQDVDNLAKCILDALNHKKTVKLMKKDERSGKMSMQLIRDAPYKDDSWIRRLSVAKTYSEQYVGSMITLDFYAEELVKKTKKGQKQQWPILTPYQS